MLNKNRLIELDFLRGLCVIFIFLRHQPLFEFTTSIGWVALEVFFVLSGFLISGLLFKEYIKFGNIDPKLFLIRRGFKIYPIYYIFYIPYLIPLLFQPNLNLLRVSGDLFFIQNYVTGFGYAYAPSWSLAVEEHFYFGFAILLYVGLRKGKIILYKNNDQPKHISFEMMLISVMVLIFVFKLVNNLVWPEQMTRNFTMTHLRMDAILAGVLISYLYYFRLDFFKSIYFKYKYLLIGFAVLALLWIPFVKPLPSFFVKTFGLTVIYLSFSVLLSYFILEPQITKKLNKVFSEPLVRILSKIGSCSYSIYIIHTFVNETFDKIMVAYDMNPYLWIKFTLSSAISIILGMLMTYKIETYFLKLRDKYFPARV